MILNKNKEFVLRVILAVKISFLREFVSKVIKSSHTEPQNNFFKGFFILFLFKGFDAKKKYSEMGN